KLSENSNKLQEIAENPKTLEKVKVISREEEDLNKFKTELESIKDLKASVDEKDFIDSVYINSIVSKKPKDLFFTSININTGNISITGASNNRLSVAELGQGLKDIENFKDIFISSVTREETVYNFDLEIDLIGEAEDGIIEEEIEESEEAQE
ncbi:MAG: PilN domain-containing protein, partial [Tissierella sp.]|uniref:PilN domain-containing protein n=1 Tax=Tissierella sp. TaxID=41274 RepID=UPI003F99FCD0